MNRIGSGSADPVVLLIDNGSRRADSTRRLRTLAAGLSGRSGVDVHPVSLQHADRVPAELLDGRPANVFGPFIRQFVERGHRRFVAVPLFFGPSRALTSFVPDQIAQLESSLGDIELTLADTLCPLPAGEPRLVDLLADNVRHASASPDRVIVVDHGSPIPQVTAVRSWLAQSLRDRLHGKVEVDEAVMERREGPEYDFNGRLLADQLAGASGDVVLAMLFLSPGRHAGEGGDIAEICAAAEAATAGLKVTPSPLVGEHDGLLEILHMRLDAALERSPAEA